MSDSLWPHGPWPDRLLCSWGFLNKNTEVGCHALIQGIFLTQGSKLHLLHYRQILYCWAAEEDLKHVKIVIEKENIHLSLWFQRNRSIIEIYVLTYILTANVWQLASSKFRIQHWPSLPILSHLNSSLWGTRYVIKRSDWSYPWKEVRYNMFSKALWLIENIFTSNGKIDYIYSRNWVGLFILPAEYFSFVLKEALL